MQSKLKVLVSLLTVAVIAIVAVFLSSGNMLAGRYYGGDSGSRDSDSERWQFDPQSGSRRESGFGRGESEFSLLPDYRIVVPDSGEPKTVQVSKIEPSSTKGYYRVTSEFKHTNPPAGQDIDWAATLNETEYPFLAWKKIAPTVEYYAFDVHESQICQKYMVNGTVKTILDPFNKVAESNEKNNNHIFDVQCPGATPLTRCDLVTTLMQKKDPHWKPKPGSVYPFADVTPDMPCYIAAQYAMENNILGSLGYEILTGGGKQNLFGPYSASSREEIAKVLFNAFKFSTNTTKNYFSDVQKTDWSYIYVQGLAQLAEKKNKLSMLMMGDGYFMPGIIASKQWFDDLLKHLF